MGSFSRSWELMKVSMHVVRKDKELLLFPLISGIIIIVGAANIAVHAAGRDEVLFHEMV